MKNYILNNNFFLTKMEKQIKKNIIKGKTMSFRAEFDTSFKTILG